MDSPSLKEQFAYFQAFSYLLDLVETNKLLNDKALNEFHKHSLKWAENLLEQVNKEIL